MEFMQDMCLPIWMCNEYKISSVFASLRVFDGFCETSANDEAQLAKG